MLIPKKVKYRRPHKVKYEGKAKGNSYLAFGDFGLVALEGAWITNRQIEACRVVMTKVTKKTGKLFIRIFPHLSKTKKPVEVRMGSGKGAPDSWVAVVKKGTIMFELSGIAESVAKKLFHLVKSKLPIKCKFIKKNNI